MSLLDRVQRNTEGATTPKEVCPQIDEQRESSPIQPRVASFPLPLLTRTETESNGGVFEGFYDAKHTNSLLSRTGNLGPSQSGGGLSALYAQLRNRIHKRLVEEYSGDKELSATEDIRQRLGDLVNEVIGEQGLTISRQDRFKNYGDFNT